MNDHDVCVQDLNYAKIFSLIKYFKNNLIIPYSILPNNQKIYNEEEPGFRSNKN